MTLYGAGQKRRKKERGRSHEYVVASLGRNSRTCFFLTNGQAVLRSSEDVLCAWLSDKAGSEQEDLLWRATRDGLSGSAANSGRASSLGCLIGEGRENERSLVDLLVVVPAVVDLSQGLLDVVGAVLAADDETDGAGRVGWDGGVGVLGNGEEASGHVEQVGDQRQVEPDAFSLRGDVTTVAKSLLEEDEVGLLEERVGGADWVGRVGDDDVELTFPVVQELEAVTDVDGDPRVVEAGSHVWKELLGDPRNGLVDVAEGGLLD